MSKSYKYIIIFSSISLFLFIAMTSNAFGLLNGSNFNSNMMLDKKFYYTSFEMNNLISSLNSEMIKTYFSLHLIDYLFILFFYPTLGLLMFNVSNKRIKILLVPLLAMVFDIIENIFIDFSLYHGLSNIVMSLTGFITLLKFGCIFISIILIIYYIIKKILK